MGSEEYMKKNLAFSIILFSVLTFRLNAAMVTFLVVETGLRETEAKKLQSQSWENNLMDTFFDAGHIVSNSIMIRMESSPKDEFKKIVIDEADVALYGGADFMVLAHLNYISGDNSPVEIVLYLYRLYPVEKIYEHRFAGSSYKSQKDETDSIRKICRGIVPHVK
jgi:hypothetical protein